MAAHSEYACHTATTALAAQTGATLNQHKLLLITHCHRAEYNKINWATKGNTKACKLRPAADVDRAQPLQCSQQARSTKSDMCVVWNEGVV